MLAISNARQPNQWVGDPFLLDGHFGGGGGYAHRLVTIEEMAAEWFARTHESTPEQSHSLFDAAAPAREVPPAVTEAPETKTPKAKKEKLVTNTTAPTTNEPDKNAATNSLWSVKDAAAFLGKSPRWIFYALQTPENQPGSIPHSRLGCNPRFIPDDLRQWAAQGFPPAATFKQWKEVDAKRARRN